jgi:dipeptidyl aminopeptidase/acylaminoacyl peptidase
MGRRERRDLRAVLAWADREGFSADRIGWLGYSMGASTVVMEGAQNSKIRAAVLDSPYGHLPELLEEQLPRYSHLPRWFNPGILTAAHLVYGVRTDDLIPIRSARSWGRRPLLLFHGEADSIVPVGQAIRLARAAGPSCQAVTLPGVEHVRAYEANPRRYVAAVNTFFRRNLSP